jgi:hypothetical protein
MGILMTTMLVIAIILYRKLKFEAELKAMNWLIKWEDIRQELMHTDDIVVVRTDCCPTPLARWH